MLSVDPEHLESFEKSLKSINCSEDIYLFTTFAQMAQTKRADLDEDFVRVIVLEIYEVSSVRGWFHKVLSRFLLLILMESLGAMLPHRVVYDFIVYTFSKLFLLSGLLLNAVGLN